VDWGWEVLMGRVSWEGLRSPAPMKSGGAEPRSLPETPAKGHVKQRIADAPLRGRGAKRCL
jgi:hypothetical protein